MSRLDEHGKVSASFELAKVSRSFENVSQHTQHTRHKTQMKFVCSSFLCSAQWTKHWFVLCDTWLRYYRDSEAEEVGPDL